MKRTLALLLAIWIIGSTPVFAHSGGTDADGGHYDGSTGDYHYHHGYSAHQHPDGICPYDYDNNTNQGSYCGKEDCDDITPHYHSSKIKDKYTPTTKTTIKQVSQKELEKEESWNVVELIGCILICVICMSPWLIPLGLGIYNSIKDIFKKGKK